MLLRSLIQLQQAFTVSIISTVNSYQSSNHVSHVIQSSFRHCGHGPHDFKLRIQITRNAQIFKHTQYSIVCSRTRNHKNHSSRERARAYHRGHSQRVGQHYGQRLLSERSSVRGSLRRPLHKVNKYLIYTHPLKLSPFILRTHSIASI